MASRSAWVVVVASAALGASLELGCAQIFGIDTACVIGEDGCAAGAGGEASGGSAGNPTGTNGGAAGSSMGSSPSDAEGEASGASAGGPTGTNGGAAGSSMGSSPSDSVGGSAVAPDAGADPCDQYCSEISTKCSEWPQYDHDGIGDRSTECANVCRAIPRTEGQGAVGNTLECRLERLSAEPLDRTACFAAGRGGDDRPHSTEEACGSKCEAYCSLMDRLCPVRFSQFASSEGRAEDQVACLDECDRLRDRGEYDPPPAPDGADERNEPETVQCRLWHLGAAAILWRGNDALRNNVHCAHAAGDDPCQPAPPPP